MATAVRTPVKHPAVHTARLLCVCENCVLACVNCNKRKADRTPPQAGMRLRNQPVRPRWQPLYARTNFLIQSWAKFISEAYWNVELET